jgi:YggT family protein
VVSIPAVIGTIAYYVLLLYFFVMWGRFIIDLVRSVNRSWRPQGALMVVIELAYSLTDPPIKFFRRLLPPLRVGPIAFDFGWSITMLCVIVAMSITGFITRL